MHGLMRGITFETTRIKEGKKKKRLLFQRRATLRRVGNNSHRVAALLADALPPRGIIELRF